MKYIIILTRLRGAANTLYTIGLRVYNSPTLRSTVLSLLWYILASADNLGLSAVLIPGQAFFTNTFVGYEVPTHLNGGTSKLKSIF
jgi:hypothetical protein